MALWQALAAWALAGYRLEELRLTPSGALASSALAGAAYAGHLHASSRFPGSLGIAAALVAAAAKAEEQHFTFAMITHAQPGDTFWDIIRKGAEAAAKIASAHAADVDANSRFPAEAFAALREHKLIGMMIPTELGGEGARAADVADVCAILGPACASTAM